MPRPAPAFPPYAPRVRCMRIRRLLVEGWDLLGTVLFWALSFPLRPLGGLHGETDAILPVQRR